MCNLVFSIFCDSFLSLIQNNMLSVIRAIYIMSNFSGQLKVNVLTLGRGSAFCGDGGVLGIINIGVF